MANCLFELSSRTSHAYLKATPFHSVLGCFARLVPTTEIQCYYAMLISRQQTPNSSRNPYPIRQYVRKKEGQSRDIKACDIHPTRKPPHMPHGPTQTCQPQKGHRQPCSVPPQPGTSSAPCVSRPRRPPCDGRFPAQGS